MVSPTRTRFERSPILAIPSIGTTLSADGAATEKWIEKSAARFLAEFAWYAEALAARRGSGPTPY